MPEVPSILVDSPAARAPAATAYKLIYTAINSAVFRVHVNNGNATDSGYRMAIVEAAAGYVDGAVPPAYSFVIGMHGQSRPIEGMQQDPTPEFTIGPGDKVVVWTDNTGVTFMPHGFSFS